MGWVSTIIFIALAFYIILLSPRLIGKSSASRGLALLVALYALLFILDVVDVIPSGLWMNIFNIGFIIIALSFSVYAARMKRNHQQS